jgi:membrane protease YdiL (CAAX protease family)
MLELIILIILVILIAASVPAYPYSRNWGYAPGGTLAAILVILLILWLLGVLRF